MSLAKEGLEKGMKEVNEGELKRSPEGLCCTKLAAAKLQWRDVFSGKSLQYLIFSGLGAGSHCSPGLS